MTKSNTVEQLSQALNQLLDAYEVLRDENKKLKENIEELELQNEDYQEQLAQLNDTTTHHKLEMNDMLSKIEGILSNKPVSNTSDSQDSQEETQTEEKIDEEVTSVEDNQATIDMTENSTEEEETIPQTTRLDLGRMQSLLNEYN